MDALVIGGDATLGRVLVDRLLVQGHRVTRTTRNRAVVDYPLNRRADEEIIYFDLLNPSLPSLPPGQHTVVYVMAAVTGIFACERDPAAWRVNAEAPALIARQAELNHFHVVGISSGTVERAQHTASARQKAYADLAILMCGGCVVRPLPYVTADRRVEVADLLITVGEERRHGVVRWGEDL